MHIEDVMKVFCEDFKEYNPRYITQKLGFVSPNHCKFYLAKGMTGCDVDMFLRDGVEFDINILKKPFDEIKKYLNYQILKASHSTNMIVTPEYVELLIFNRSGETKRQEKYWNEVE